MSSLLKYLGLSAGSVMYEHATKLGSDLPGLKGLQGQAKCLLAAMNALRLGDPKYAWIVRPTATKADDEDEEFDEELTASPPKRSRRPPSRDTVCARFCTSFDCTSRDAVGLFACRVVNYV